MHLARVLPFLTGRNLYLLAACFDLYFRLEWLSTATYVDIFFLLFFQGNEPILNLKICDFILVLASRTEAHPFNSVSFPNKTIVTENISRKIKQGETDLSSRY